ncbi:MAG: hypothetical protein JSS68_05020 [Actinobacteria bacterium]|nr:hypothetical protein [Actinomycetota bacterium]
MNPVKRRHQVEDPGADLGDQRRRDDRPAEAQPPPVDLVAEGGGDDDPTDRPDQVHGDEEHGAYDISPQDPRPDGLIRLDQLFRGEEQERHRHPERGNPKAAVAGSEHVGRGD